MTQPFTLPQCIECNEPMVARHIGSHDGIFERWAECPKCGLRSSPTKNQWLELRRPQRPADIDAAYLTPARLAALGLLPC